MKFQISCNVEIRPLEKAETDGGERYLVLVADWRIGTLIALSDGGGFNFFAVRSSAVEHHLTILDFLNSLQDIGTGRVM